MWYGGRKLSSAGHRHAAGQPADTWPYSATTHTAPPPPHTNLRDIVVLRRGGAGRWVVAAGVSEELGLLDHRGQHRGVHQQVAKQRRRRALLRQLVLKWIDRLLARLRPWPRRPGAGVPQRPPAAALRACQPTMKKCGKRNWPSCIGSAPAAVRHARSRHCSTAAAYGEGAVPSPGCCCCCCCAAPVMRTRITLTVVVVTLSSLRPAVRGWPSEGRRRRLLPGRQPAAAGGSGSLVQEGAPAWRHATHPPPAMSTMSRKVTKPARNTTLPVLHMWGWKAPSGACSAILGLCVIPIAFSRGAGGGRRDFARAEPPSAAAWPTCGRHRWARHPSAFGKATTAERRAKRLSARRQRSPDHVRGPGWAALCVAHARGCARSSNSGPSSVAVGGRPCR